MAPVDVDIADSDTGVLELVFGFELEKDVAVAVVTVSSEWLRIWPFE